MLQKHNIDKLKEKGFVHNETSPNFKSPEWLVPESLIISKMQSLDISL